MSVDFAKGEFVVDCDGADCIESETFFVDTFQEGIDEIKAMGWRLSKNGGTWYHYCPDCKEDYEGW